MDFEQKGGYLNTTGKKDKKSKKYRILMSAIYEFSEKGYDKAVLDEVASNAGVAKGTLYLYFKDKEDLFLQTILYVVDGIVNTVKNVLNRNENPLKKIEMMIKEQVNYFIENKEYFGIFQTIMHEDLLKYNREIFNILQDRKRKIISILREVIEEAKSQGLIRKEIHTMDVVNICDGVIFSLLKFIRLIGLGIVEGDRDYLNLNSRIASLIDILFYGIATKRPYNGEEE